MLSDNGKISGRQAAWILILDMTAVGLFGLSDILIVQNPILLLAVGLIWLIVWSGVDYLLFLGKKYCRPVVLSVVKWVWVVLCIVAILYSVKYFYSIVDTLVPVHYGNPVLLLLIPVLYSAAKGMEVRGRTAELLGWLVVVPLLILFMTGLWQAFGEMSFMDLWETSGTISLNIRSNEAKYTALLFLMADNPWMIRAYTENQQYHSGKRWKKISGAVVGMIIGALINLMALLMTGLYLRPEGMGREKHPFGIVLQLIRLPINFISRYDIFYIVLWMVCFSLFLSGIVIRIIELTRIREYAAAIKDKYQRIVGENGENG